MGEDGIADDDLQVVSGERELENLAPKERAKLEKKRGLIRAGMGAAADDVEDTGFEVAKANGAAMAMLGKRYKPKFAVDGLEVMDDREYGSDEVRVFLCVWCLFSRRFECPRRVFRVVGGRCWGLSCLRPHSV